MARRAAISSSEGPCDPKQGIRRFAKALFPLNGRGRTGIRVGYMEINLLSLQLPEPHGLRSLGLRVLDAPSHTNLLLHDCERALLGILSMMLLLICRVVS